ncbi:MAG: twin-arginine translocase TatA/TatE family subunit [Pirellulaceae bacterium]
MAIVLTRPIEYSVEMLNVVCRYSPAVIGDANDKASELARGATAMFGVGTFEILIVGLVGLLLFGHRFPQIMRDMGRGISEFKRGIHDHQLEDLREK